MSGFLSAGVFPRENDLSLYISNLSKTSLGMVGLATKGPINVPTFVVDAGDFASKFGDPSDPAVETLYAAYAALQYLHIGNALQFVRVSESDPDDPDGTITGSSYLAKYAKASITETTTPATITGTINTLLSISSSNNVLHFVVDGSTPGFDVTFTVSGTVTKSITEIVSLLNANAVFATYMVASTSSTGTLQIKRLVDGTDHSIQISGLALSAGNIFGFPLIGVTAYTPITLGTGIITENAFIIGSNVGATVTITGSSNDLLTVWIGTTKANAAAVAYTIPAAVYSSVDNLVIALNAISGFSTDLIASSFSDASGVGQVKVAIKAGSTKKHLALAIGATDAGPTVFGFIGSQLAVISNNVTFPQVISTGINDTLIFLKEDYDGTDTSVTVTVPAASYASVAALVTALNGLSVANLTFSSITVSAVAHLKVLLGTLDGLVLTGGTALATLFGTQAVEKRDTTTTSSTIDIQAFTQGTWGNAVKVEVTNVNTSLGIFDLIVYNKGVQVEAWRKLSKDSDNVRFVETIVNDEKLGSKNISVTNGTGAGALALPIATGGNPRTALSGGTNGAPPSNTSDPSLYIGYDDGVTVTGLQYFRNPDALDISILAVPGISDAAVINEMIDICSTRADCMAIVDPPSGYTPSQVVDWVNGQGAYTDHQAFNSSYAAVYWPWMQVNDPINKVTIYTPPSGLMAGVFAATDNKFDPWIAPAGLLRGKLNTPIKAQYTPKKGDLDLLYSNNINPIATFKLDGINVWGQKTLQRATTALDRINVRRLMIFIETLVASTTRRLVFEPDDENTWTAFVNLVEPFIQSIKDRRGVSDFRIICDASVNKANELNNSEMRALVFIKPIKAAEFIQIDFNIMEQGANFSELTF